ncbi:MULTISPECIES: metal-dependent hydrolase [Enterobacteriaceae]|uniref:Metal-dependent hydrolase n=1 Tax=Kluyvera genomosp. 2 TaxID=2774054 RepID=A0A2T2Y393_9ENTR|nr:MULTISPECIES: metal-dependent hydrolase [Enterobacteriaceae]HAT3918507.1 metal-dependent hydrolase [Kluyvera ascorbata]PSR47024.1 metal-dependent hydrolase [Kluyvera genomosp. 2]HAT3943420.1 metal-dependent hydrolase [Kluyvera ascorbata]HAT3948666.1 metal-dependent hydrolase [Kluyvera ascorbata]HAT3954986.1 metal-dependent hydrolase [Kluyvera ascorbata]
MTAEGHLLFSIACAVFAKNAELTPVLAQGDWWHIVPSAILTCLLPDIDHPRSFLGQRLSWLSKPIARMCGHRGFTHSLLAVFGALTLFYLKVPDSWIVPADAVQGMVLGYLSHILADMLTPAGVPLLWPCRWRFRLPILAPRKGNQLERVLCMALFAYAVFMPQSLPDNSVVRWSSSMINLLQNDFDRFINRRAEQ